MNDGDPRGRWRHQRQRVADVLTQRIAKQREEEDEARYRPAWGDRWPQMRDHIQHIVDQAPPLTHEQLDRLALLLKPTRETS